MLQRAQGGLEYLLTYGWALVLVAAIAGALVFIGLTPATENVVFSSSDTSKLSVKGGAMQGTVATLKLINVSGGAIKVKTITPSSNYLPDCLLNKAELLSERPVPVGGEMLIECFLDTGQSDPTGYMLINFDDFSKLRRTVTIRITGQLSRETCTDGQKKACLLTNGVCAGAQTTCASGSWPDCNSATYYNNNSNYEESEASCTDTFDNDCDAFVDCEDSDCTLEPSCAPETDCSNSIDDDTDGSTDCLDSDCFSDPACLAESNCNNSIDDDLDTYTDCDDSDCDASPYCMVETDCGNSIDDDSDTFTDCADSDCNAMTGPGGMACQPFGETYCSDTFDNDADGQTDCADSNCFASPLCLPESNCSNGVDDDIDTFTDCADSDCDGLSGPSGETCEPGGETSCSDGHDNDNDGQTDCGDSDCSAAPNCLPETNCSNGLDDDLDSDTDCADSDCDGLSGPSGETCEPSGETSCNDGHDNDNDGSTDCVDSDCFSAPVCLPESNCSNGLDDDEDTYTDCVDPDCDGLPGSGGTCQTYGETTCNDSFDNDADGQTDCSDSDCTSNPVCLPETNCNNGLDDDEDTYTDCADSDCASDPFCLATKTTIYVSTGTTNGQLGNRSSADSLCSSGKPANLPGSCATIHAFISMSATDEIQDMVGNYGYTSSNPVYWWHSTNGTYTQFASNWTDMLDESIAVSMQTGTGSSLAPMTVSTSSGAITSYTCVNFTSKHPGQLFTSGSPTSTSSTWLDNGTTACNVAVPLLCMTEC